MKTNRINAITLISGRDLKASQFTDTAGAPTFTRRNSDYDNSIQTNKKCKR